MKISQLATKPNLLLAWRRITTGGNYQYKNLFRRLYYAYEVALDENIRDLRIRLLGGSFVAHHPERVYVPKASGLHRPLGLLGVEDQIVLQAFANLAAKRMQPRRADLQFSAVFSNILEKPSSIFLFRKWQDTYRAFQTQIDEHFRNGLRWVGDFDLAAFYDTISHELLLRTIYPRTTSEDLKWFAGCLHTWSSGCAASGHGHGLPQGPIASDLLAEYFLLPVDLAIRESRGYLRYVDDFRLLGMSEDEVRRSLIILERQCRERGLIPQKGKFSLKKVHSAQDAMGMLPSISDPQHDEGRATIRGQFTRAAIMPAITSRPYRVLDKTRLRYILYRAEPEGSLLNLVLRLIPRHPEHSDVFFAYLGRFGYRRPIERLAHNLVERNPYSCLRGEAWHTLARYVGEERSLTYPALTSFVDKAIAIARQRGDDNFPELWGACHFLCAAEPLTSGKYSSLLRRQSPLLQALLAPVLPDSAFTSGGAAEGFLRQTRFEPGISLSAELHNRGWSLSTFNLRSRNLPTQVVNTLRELGDISSPGRQVDPIAEVLQARFGVPQGRSWHCLLDEEYVHALGLLKQAEATFDAGRSFWLACLNSFNQTLFLALQRHFSAIGNPGACRTIDKNGQLVNFGVTLDQRGPFSRNYPVIADCFRKLNARRNELPVAHPYEKKTRTRARYLTSQERNELVSDLRAAYNEVVANIP